MMIITVKSYKKNQEKVVIQMIPILFVQRSQIMSKFTKFITLSIVQLMKLVIHNQQLVIMKMNKMMLSRLKKQVLIINN